MTDTELDEIEARASAATQGDWYHETDNGPWAVFDRAHAHGIIAIMECATHPRKDGLPSYNERRCDCFENARFIARAREDIPRLVAEVRRLRGLVRTMTEEHRSAMDSAADAFMKLPR